MSRKRLALLTSPRTSPTYEPELSACLLSGAGLSIRKGAPAVCQNFTGSRCSIAPALVGNYDD